MIQRSFLVRLLGTALGTIIVAGDSFASFTTDFQSDSIGSPPSGWILVGTNSTDATALVAAEGANKFLALRDASADLSVLATIQDAFGQEKSGYVQFDIRFNQGVTHPGFSATVLGTPDGWPPHLDSWNPIVTSFFHNFHDTNQPLVFRSTGNNDYNVVTNDFPFGSWQTIRINFSSSGGGPPRGTYSILWNGITNHEVYLDQGSSSMNMDALSFGGLPWIPNGTLSVDIDNILFIPEPGALGLLGGALLLLVPGRRKRQD